MTAGLKALVLTPILVALPIDIFDLTGPARTVNIVVAVAVTVAALIRCFQIKLLSDDWGIESRDFWIPRRMAWEEMTEIGVSAGDLLNVTFATEVAFFAPLPREAKFGQRRLISAAATIGLSRQKRDALQMLLRYYADKHGIHCNLGVAPNGNWDTVHSPEKATD